MEKYPPLSDSLVILRTTTHLSLTVPSSWWKHYPPLADNSIILVTTTHLYLTGSSSCEPPRTSYWQFYHTGDQNAILPDSSIIQGTTAHFYLTVPSSWGPRRISTWQFRHRGDRFPLLPENFIFLKTASHNLPEDSIILWTTTHLNRTVPSPLHTSTWLFQHPGDHYPCLPDRFVILQWKTYHNVTECALDVHTECTPFVKD